MKEFNKLIKVAEQLLGPEGCSWDREQTLYTLQPYLLEETHELIEAIDEGEMEKISEEWGDVLYALIFIAKLCEFKKGFTIEQAIEGISEKLIRRHPHVFGDVKVSSNEEIIHNWEEIKKKEKAQEKRKGIFDGIPPTLPSLPKAQKMAKKVRKAMGREVEPIQEEAEVGELLWTIVQRAERGGVDAESALRRKLAEVQKKGPEIGPRHEGLP